VKSTIKYIQYIIGVSKRMPIGRRRTDAYRAHRPIRTEHATKDRGHKCLFLLWLRTETPIKYNERSLPVLGSAIRFTRRKCDVKEGRTAEELAR
jgi:hypothetical protein